MITIDVSEVTDERPLHLLLMRELGSPVFHGMNWDAYAITGPVWIPEHVLPCLGQLGAGVPRVAARLRRALDDSR
ncbi:ribonuclease inhibitor [Streptomyces ipomoeae]|uniref:ribonuclease inhibitor n=1 Tax=Streptomyces ipomoeae TaxID=103232 RepID=UPI0011466313|nr:ribonuclease inhibitor [Streptomyces ipomoeae]MDX2822665.1 ribonuclease inhibitor [Streptomyces ipomoeae]MDX2875559.1 ribonuclease inhibitor [Streptomyces ipomoeae]TQE37267.1 ribonuclease inhibitor [Streptomyces ipomoeae]